MQSLEKDVQLQKAKALVHHGGLAEIRFHELDIADTRSIKDFAKYLKRSHEEGIDFVINNASIAMQDFDESDRLSCP